VPRQPISRLWPKTHGAVLENWIRLAAFALASPAGLAFSLFVDGQTCIAHPEFEV